MGLVARCPLTDSPCTKTITIEEKTFFLSETEKPEADKKRRNQAINEATKDGYKVRSALEEKRIYAFTCKICEMIQTCEYGIADISKNNANVFIELGMMLALGKPTILLVKNRQTKKLKLPSNLVGIEVIPFEEYLDIIAPLRECLKKLPTTSIISTPIENLEKIAPQIAQNLEKFRDEIVKEFKKNAEKAELDTSLSREDKKELSPELNKRLNDLEEKLDVLKSLGLVADAKTSFIKGNYFYKKGKFEEAIKSYSWSIEIEPNNPNPFNNRGLSYYELKQYNEALADYNKAIELKPDYPEILNNRGNTHLILERYDEALADFNSALLLKPRYVKALVNRGGTYLKLERYNEAMADFNHALSLKPDEAAIFYGRGLLYSKLKENDKALSDYNQALLLKKDYIEALVNRSVIYFKLEKYNEAMADNNRALSLKPDNTEILNNRGVNYLKLEKYDEALVDFKKALDLKPDDTGTFYNLACLFSLQNKIDDALAYLEKAIKKDKEYKEEAKIDKDFSNIKNDPRFKKLIGDD